MLGLLPYKSELCKVWDDIVVSATNGHFLFQRNYMDYHSDRFIDASYIVTYKSKPIGVLPGSQVGSIWISHAGLTFGGLIVNAKNNRISFLIDVYRVLIKELKLLKYTSALIKPVPWIYHNSPCEGEIYAIQQLQLPNTKMLLEATTTIDLRCDKHISTLRKRKKKLAISEQLSVKREKDMSRFYLILTKRLEDKYQKTPVHSLAELEMLSDLFPENILLYTVVNKQNEVLGGCIIYSSNNVWHSQYVAATEQGMALGGLDLLFFHLFDKAKLKGAQFFDFGISTENNGRVLNEKLASFKEGFGGRALLHHKIELSLM